MFPFCLQITLPRQAILHEEWTGNRADGNDIALLQLAMESQHVFSGLPSVFEELRPGDDFVALGWGVEASDSDDLQQVANIQFLPNQLCDSNWPDIDIQDAMMCAFGDILNGEACGGMY